MKLKNLPWSLICVALMLACIVVGILYPHVKGPPNPEERAAKNWQALIAINRGDIIHMTNGTSCIVSSQGVTWIELLTVNGLVRREKNEIANEMANAVTSMDGRYQMEQAASSFVLQFKR